MTCLRKRRNASNMRTRNAAENKSYYAFERMLGIAGPMMPEHGCLWVVGIGEDNVLAFTEFGIDNLQDSIIATRESMKKK
jgi:hypothetical protein